MRTIYTKIQPYPIFLSLQIYISPNFRPTKILHPSSLIPTIIYTHRNRWVYGRRSHSGVYTIYIFTTVMYFRLSYIYIPTTAIPIENSSNSLSVRNKRAAIRYEFTTIYELYTHTPTHPPSADLYQKLQTYSLKKKEKKSKTKRNEMKRNFLLRFFFSLFCFCFSSFLSFSSRCCFTILIRVTILCIYPPFCIIFLLFNFIRAWSQSVDSPPDVLKMPLNSFLSKKQKILHAR